MNMIELNFDGLVGPTHNFAGLSLGNVASLANENAESSPRAAALQGIGKMRAVADLGAPQAVLPPQMRPSLSTLHALGYRGPAERVLPEVAEREPRLLRLVSSASAMWAANAATVAPALDTSDERLHVVPANLRHMFHRSIEADVTRDVLRAIFSDPKSFVVHDPLPGGSHFADEGAANHTRLASDAAVVHLFAWGRSAFTPREDEPRAFPARQTLEASQAVARLLQLPESLCLFARQHPDGIERGAFHTDVLAVGTGTFFMMHERAFAEPDLAGDIARRLGPSARVVVARDSELPVEDAVASYPFNSQVLALEGGRMVVVAPLESRENPRARAFLERVVAEDNPVDRVVYLDVRQSMRNGGGPACLRQRIPLRDSDLSALGARVVFDASLERDLRGWVERHYRERLLPRDLADPALWRECMQALDELTGLLRLGPVYEFQR